MSIFFDIQQVSNPSIKFVEDGDLEPWVGSTISKDQYVKVLKVNKLSSNSCLQFYFQALPSYMKFNMECKWHNVGLPLSVRGFIWA